MIPAVVYAACLILAALTVPSLSVFLTYGLPTWLGGAMFTLVVTDLTRHVRKPTPREPS